MISCECPIQGCRSFNASRLKREEKRKERELFKRQLKDGIKYQEARNKEVAQLQRDMQTAYERENSYESTPFSHVNLIRNKGETAENWSNPALHISHIIPYPRYSHTSSENIQERDFTYEEMDTILKALGEIIARRLE